MIIQDVLLSECFKYLASDFHLNTLRVAACAWGLELSYKQARDALYRLRCKGVSIRHDGLGWYRWV